MYSKYLIKRIRNAPSKFWDEWKIWRNYPSMEYRDVHKVLPGSYMWRFPAPGSEKVEESFTPQWFEKDYKTAYRNSKHYVSKLRPDLELPNQKFFNFQIDEDSKNTLKNLLCDIEINVSEANSIIDINNIELDKLKEKAQTYVKGYLHFSDINCQTFENNYMQQSLDDHYFLFTENFGGDRGLDVSDGYPFWNILYLDGQNLKMREDYKLKVYHGRTKSWQVLPDTFPKDQIDMIQAATFAPLSDQLDQWEMENINKKMDMPINNENLHKVRDFADAYEILDHDYERIIYERQHNQLFEQMRNTRYNELLRSYFKNI